MPKASTKASTSKAVDKPTKKASPKPELQDIEMLDGFSSEDDSSSGEAEADEELVDVQNLPLIVTDGKGIDKKLAKASPGKPGVIYLGRLPKGFEEKQLKSYLEQFGKINRLRLSRNKKTGASKHYAFVEFTYESVAKIVVETMNNYLLLGHILVCKFVDQDDVHPTLFVGAGKNFKVMPRNIKSRTAHNSVKTVDQQTRISKRLLSKQHHKKEKIQALGLDYDFEGHKEPAPEQKVIMAK